MGVVRYGVDFGVGNEMEDEAMRQHFIFDFDEAVILVCYKWGKDIGLQIDDFIHDNPMDGQFEYKQYVRFVMEHFEFEECKGLRWEIAPCFVSRVE